MTKINAGLTTALERHLALNDPKLYTLFNSHKLVLQFLLSPVQYKYKLESTIGIKTQFFSGKLYKMFILTID